MHGHVAKLHAEFCILGANNIKQDSIPAHVPAGFIVLLNTELSPVNM